MINQRINTIKILAIILVIFNHTYTYLFKFSEATNFMKLEFVVCRTAVPLFLMCTGFLLNNKNNSLKITIKRITRVLIPLIFFSFLIWILREKSINLTFFCNFIKAPIIEPYWYCYMLIGLYLIIPFLNKIIKNCSSLELLFLIILTICPTILSFIKINVSDYWFMSNFSYILSYYLIGALISKINYKSVYCKISFIIFILLLLYGVLNYDNLNLFLIDNLFIIILSVTLFLSVYGIPLLEKQKISGYISNLVFGVYLIHPIIQNKIFEIEIIQKIFNKSPNTGLILLQISIIICCFLLVYLFKNILGFLENIIKERGIKNDKNNCF